MHIAALSGIGCVFPDAEKTDHPFLPENQMLTWEHNRWPGIGQEPLYLQHLIRQYVFDLNRQPNGIPHGGKTIKDGAFYSSVMKSIQTDHIFPELAENDTLTHALTYVDQLFGRWYGNGKGTMQWEPVQCVGWGAIISALYPSVPTIGATGTAINAVDFIPSSVRERTAFPYRPVDFNGYQVIPLSDTVKEFDAWHFFQPGDFMVYYDPKNPALETGHMLYIQAVTRNMNTGNRDLVFVSDANFQRQTSGRISCNGLPRTCVVDRAQFLGEFGGDFSHLSVLRAYCHP